MAASSMRAKVSGPHPPPAIDLSFWIWSTTKTGAPRAKTSSSGAGSGALLNLPRFASRMMSISARASSRSAAVSQDPSWISCSSSHKREES